VIEQTMIFALGFLAAGLAALAFAPAFWRRANRLTRRQLEMQIPLSVHEILAERDQLRAEFAVERCRLDQRAEQLGDQHAADLAELGRQAARISKLQSDFAANTAAMRESAQARAQSIAQLVAAEAELGALNKALYDSEGQRERKQNEFLEYIRLQESMKLLAEMRFAALAASDARVASLELRLGDVRRNLIEAEHRLAQKDLHMRSLTDVLNGVRHEREVAEKRISKVQEKFEAEARRAVQLGEELSALRRQHDGDLSQLRTLMVKMNVNDAALEDSRRREKDILAQRDLLAERARDAERGLSEKYVHLRSEHAATQGALDVARQRCEELESILASRNAATSEPQQAAASTDADAHALLRQSISEIGTAIIGLMRPNGDGTAAGVGLHFPTASIPPALVKTDTAAEARAATHEPIAS
jgi:hypothetical protein